MAHFLSIEDGLQPDTSAWPGKQFVPSNSDEGECFIESHCAHCIHDKISNGQKDDWSDCTDEDLCPVLAASYRGAAKEWRLLSNGDSQCMSFHAVDEPIRCTHTLELPLDTATPAQP